MSFGERYLRNKESILKKIKQLFCSHKCYLEDLERLSDTKVVCICNKCGKQLKAPYGLAINCQWQRK